MPSYIYYFRAGGHEASLLYTTASNALGRAVSDLHDRQAEPLRIDRDGQPLYDRALIERAYAACRAELEADRWKVPSPLQRLAARESGGSVL